jgi:FAD/FMN-containing dehydrogenase
MAMRRVASWGRLSADLHEVLTLPDRMAVAEILRSSGHGIARGQGRSYGDACLNPAGVLWCTERLDRFMHFDVTTGRLRCEAGVLLRDLQRLVVPRGWMLPVSPGTQMVSVGGAIANDVHGKNHHAFGTFGDHVTRLALQRTTGECIECGPDDQREWFCATVGGAGLTGLIVWAELQLRKIDGPWMETEVHPFESLDRFFQLSEGSSRAWEYTVAWIDCLAGDEGRGLFMRANHSTRSTSAPVQRPPRRIPFTPPVSLVNGVSLRAFNTAYFHVKQWKPSSLIQHYEPFFYPLDSLLEWNRMYGPRGFFQYQCVVPLREGGAATRALLQEISGAGMGSFLAVLKVFGERAAQGMLSFAGPGVTLALDFPNRGSDTERLFARLDAVVNQAGGRLYLAKDARMPRALFEASYPRLQAFRAYRDPGMSSALSRRLLGA